MECLGKNGVLVLASVTGGDRKHPVPADKINLDFVETGVYDFARAELEFPGWLSKLLTHPVAGLEDYQDMMQTRMTERGAIKVFVNVAYDAVRCLAGFSSLSVAEEYGEDGRRHEGSHGKVGVHLTFQCSIPTACGSYTERRPSCFRSRNTL